MPTCMGQSTVNFRLLVREKAKIHRSHKRVFNGLVVDIYTMWFNSIVPPLHGFCVCMDVSMTSNLKFTVSIPSPRNTRPQCTLCCVSRVH